MRSTILAWSLAILVREVYAADLDPLDIVEVRVGTCEAAGYKTLAQAECAKAAADLGLVSNGVGAQTAAPGGCSIDEQHEVTWTVNQDTSADPDEKRFLLCQGTRLLGAHLLGDGQEEPIMPTNIEIAYKSHVGYGTGYHRVSREIAASPFEDTPVEIKTEGASLYTTVHRGRITSTENFSEAMRATASVSGSGWGVKARADFQLDRVDSFSASEVMFIYHASKNFGFEGWPSGVTPNFTATARNHLCKDGSFSEKEFEEIYGSYYVAGIYKGSSLDIYISFTTSTTNSDEKVSASMEVAWQGFGKSASASATFAQEVAQNSSYSNLVCHAKTFGVEEGFLPDVTLENAQDVIDEYKLASTGVGITLLLQKYSSLEIYQEIAQECHNTIAQTPVDELWLQSITGYVVEMKLNYQVMTNAASPSECMFDLILEAGQYIEKWSNIGYLDSTATFATQALEEKKLITNRWDRVENICASEVVKCQCLTPNDYHYGKNQYVCDDANSTDQDTFCKRDEICSATGHFRKNVLSTGCQQVRSCVCLDPTGGTPNGNEFNCNWGEPGWCKQWETCQSEVTFKFAVLNEEACAPVTKKVCTCDHPGDKSETSFTCMPVSKQYPSGDPSQKEVRACGGGQTCMRRVQFLYGRWDEACIDNDQANQLTQGAMLGAPDEIDDDKECIRLLSVQDDTKNGHCKGEYFKAVLPDVNGRMIYWQVDGEDIEDKCWAYIKNSYNRQYAFIRGGYTDEKAWNYASANAPYFGKNDFIAWPSQQDPATGNQLEANPRAKQSIYKGTIITHLELVPCAQELGAKASEESSEELVAPEQCTQSDVKFKGSFVKVKADDVEDCFDKCEANKKMNGKTCQGWAWKAGSKKPCRLYKKIRGTKERAGMVIGLRSCHPTNGQLEDVDTDSR